MYFSRLYCSYYIDYFAIGSVLGKTLHLYVYSVNRDDAVSFCYNILVKPDLCLYYKKNITFYCILIKPVAKNTSVFIVFAKSSLHHLLRGIQSALVTWESSTPTSTPITKTYSLWVVALVFHQSHYLH